MLALVALSTAVVIGGTTYLQQHLIVETVESEALDAASATAVGVAAAITEHDEIPSATELDDMLTDFARMVPELRALTVTVLQPDGSVAVGGSTEEEPPAGVRGLSHQAIAARDRAVSGPLPGPMRLVAVPLERDRRPYGAVVVSISMGAVARVHGETRMVALAIAPVAILVLTALLHALTGDLVLTPLDTILAIMRRASAGDLAARVPTARRDEIGAVAAGLNAMLDRVSDFNDALQREVRGATETLRERNRQLAESAQGLFAARRDLARSEQLATAGQMAASVAHQIGTPLNLISGYVQMMLADTPPDGPAAARLRTVQEQIGRVTAIVQGLLDQARQPILHRETVPAAELVRRVCELAEPTLQAAGIALRTEVPPGLPELDVDVGQLEQVFLNLITNSMDAMPRGGGLTVAAGQREAQVEFTFADTGTGIAPENVSRVFDPLFTTKRPGKGTGLGLTIAREVLAAHGGSIAVDSRPGQGTSVTVRVPTRAASAPAAEERGA